MDSREQHANICEELNSIYYRKNQDYGDSFSRQFEKYGLLSSLIRLDDKMSRLDNLLTHHAKVEESIEDTLLDLANYAIMTVMEMRKDE